MDELQSGLMCALFFHCITWCIWTGTSENIPQWHWQCIPSLLSAYWLFGFFQSALSIYVGSGVGLPC